VIGCGRLPITLKDGHFSSFVKGLCTNRIQQLFDDFGCFVLPGHVLSLKDNSDLTRTIRSKTACRRTSQHTDHAQRATRNEANVQLCQPTSPKATGVYPERSEGWRGQCARVSIRAAFRKGQCPLRRSTFVV
jgi:hypothetical protein